MRIVVSFTVHIGGRPQLFAMGQAVRKLDAEIAQLKASMAAAEQTGSVHSEETKATHDKQVAAMKLANDMLQQQLARMAESVPAMLRWGTST